MNIYQPEPRSGKVVFVRNQVILIMRTNNNRTWDVSSIYLHLRDCHFTRKQIFNALHVHANAFKQVSRGNFKLVEKYQQDSPPPVDTETDAMKILQARRSSYAPQVCGFADETELLLLQQHYAELARRNKLRGET